MRDQGDWSAGSWEGSRREMIRRNLRLSPGERLALLGSLGEFGEIVREGGSSEYRGSPPEVALAGCRPTPLASYLKALGVLRLVAEQVDPTARGRWADDGFRIETTLSDRDLLDFFLKRYAPTPVLAPWNGGSGFHPRDNHSGISPMEASQADRFSSLRETIATIRGVLVEMGITDGMRPEVKGPLLGRLRAELSDEALVWFDAAVLLTEDSPRYPPLLGTGGNDGRLDFTNNFLQRLVELLDPDSGEPRAGAEALLRGALFGEPIPNLWGAAMGQYAPSDIGGANATTGFSADTLMNPWDFVLMLEGALLFAASAARRLESTTGGRLSYPFTVRPTGAGSGSIAPGDEGSSRGEIWMPLWRRSVGLPEVAAVLGEGRAVLNGRPARDGLDFVRAVSKLGVDRGLSEFVRYGFLMRNGKAYLATPLTRVKVRSNPESELIDELDGRDGWLTRFTGASGGKNAPDRLRSLGRRLQNGLFRMARSEGGKTLSPVRIQEVLITLGQIQHYYSTSPGGRENTPPVPALSTRWVQNANDGSPDFLVAAALAGLHAERTGVAEYGGEQAQGSAVGNPGAHDPRGRGMRMAAHFAPVAGDRRVRGWVEGSGDVVLGEGDLLRSLRGVLERRLLRAERDGVWAKPLSGSFGAPLAAVEAWLQGGSAFDMRVGRLLPGLSLARIPGSLPHSLAVGGWNGLPISYAILKPFFTPERDLLGAGFLRASEGSGGNLPLSLGLVRAIAAEPAFRRPGEAGVLRQAYRHLRRASLAAARGPGEHEGTGSEAPHLSPALQGVDSLGVEGRRMLAVLMVPLSAASLRSLSGRLLVPAEPRITPSHRNGAGHQPIDPSILDRE